MSTIKKYYSDLIIEASVPRHADDQIINTCRGFSVISSSDGVFSYKTVVTGDPTVMPLKEKQSLLLLCSEIIGQFFQSANIEKSSKALVVGLGNPSVASDSLGSQVADRIITDGKQVFSFRPSTKAKTGFETAELVSLVAKQAESDFIIAIDSLAARKKERLGTVIQFSDSGIVPGSGVSASSGEISCRTMPCPVISVGVPTVIGIRDSAVSPLLVTPTSVGSIVESFAVILSGGINTSIAGNILSR